MIAVTYRPCGVRVDFVCNGPDKSGKCPRVATGQIVPCAGRKLALPKDVTAPNRRSAKYRVYYRVPIDEVYCPLVAMEPEVAGPLSEIDGQ